jgi:hypothetical protein
MLYPGRRPVVPGGNYTLIPDKNSTDMTPQAGRTLGDQLCYAHKVFFPGWAYYFFHGFTIKYIFFMAARRRIKGSKMAGYFNKAGYSSFA